MQRHPNIPSINVKEQDSPFIVFLHIAKTAGMSLNAVLIKQFRETILAGNVAGVAQSRCGMYRLQDVANSYASLSAAQKLDLQVCIGHNFFGLHKLINRSCKYVTLVRDPVDRCISTFNYLLQQKMIPNSTSFEEFVSLNLVICNSFQTRQICGSPSLDLSSNYDPDTLLTKSSVTDNRQVGWIDYLQAIYNIRRHFLLCAPSERFDEATLILAYIFGWSQEDVIQQRINVTNPTIHRNEISEELIEKLRQQNKYDEKLYRFVTQNFDRLVKSLGEEFQSELAGFRSQAKSMASLSTD